jgi:hypothetical protein
MRQLTLGGARDRAPAESGALSRRTNGSFSRSRWVIDRAAIGEMDLLLCASFYRKGMVSTWERF